MFATAFCRIMIFGEKNFGKVLLGVYIMTYITLVKFLLPPFCVFLKFLFGFKENFYSMEEIPVEYNIIIEALNCAVQNHQQTEGNEGQANFEFVVINNPVDEQVQAEGQSTLECVEPTQPLAEHVEAIEAHITFESANNTSESIEDGGTVCADVETTQATEAIQPKEKTHKCDVCNKAFLHAGRVLQP